MNFKMLPVALIALSSCIAVFGQKPRPDVEAEKDCSKD